MGAGFAVLVVVALLAAQDLVSVRLGRVFEVAIVATLAILLVCCELARRNVVSTRAQLIFSQRFFSFTQKASKIGNWQVDADGKETWSSSFREILGIGAAVPASTPAFRALVHPDDREEFERDDARMVNVAGEHEHEFRIVRPDGEVRCILVRGLCVTSSGKGRVLGIAIDITDRKHAEAELVRSGEVLRLAQAAGRLGTFDANLETGELHWTTGMYEITGLDPRSYRLATGSPADYIHPADLAEVQAESARLIASGESYYELSNRIVRPSGAIRSVFSRGTVFRREDGTPTRVVGVMLDETERKSIELERARLETRLRQADKIEALGQLAGGVAHDFNNLLVAIGGYAELALGRLSRGEEGAAKDIQGVIAAAESASGLTAQLLAFGRRQVLNPEVVDLNEVVKRTDGFLQRVIGDDVELVAALAPKPVLVKADRGQLEQVITNLVVNGRDAMPEGGRLTVQVGTAQIKDGDAAGRHATLSVTDEGSGIDPATASQIFEPFFSTKGNAGTGLGLATVHGIVAQSGGQVALDTDVGVGSTFTISLPLATEKPSPARAAAKPMSYQGTETILLVEDDPTVRSIVSRMLTERGYEVIDAGDGEEAILLFEQREQPIQLVLSDLIMGGLGGRATSKRIRTIEPATKVLYMSGYSDDITIRSGGLESATGFIQKPFSGHALAECVRGLLDAETPTSEDKPLATPIGG